MLQKIKDKKDKVNALRGGDIFEHDIEVLDGMLSKGRALCLINLMFSIIL